MPKKIPQNSICPLCNSQLRDKDCCGKNQGLKPTSMRYIIDKQNKSKFDKHVYNILNHYPNEYNKPIKNIGDVFYILVDESNIKNHYSIGGILIYKKEVENNKILNSKLTNLVEKYFVDHIHFTDIFGKRILGTKKTDFINEYIEIIKPLNIIPFTVCMNEDEIKDYLKINRNDKLKKDDYYIALTCKLMF